MARIISFIVLVAILLVMGALFFQVMAGFFVPLFLAVLLVVMFRPVHRWFVSRCRGRERLAAGLTTLAILAIVMAPLLLVLIQAGFEASSIARHWDSAVVKEKLAVLRQQTGLLLPPEPVLASLDRLDTAIESCRQPGHAPDRPQLAEMSAALDELLVLMTAELRAAKEIPAWSATQDPKRLRDDLAQLAAARSENEIQRASLLRSRLDALRTDLLAARGKSGSSVKRIRRKSNSRPGGRRPDNLPIPWRWAGRNTQAISCPTC